MLYRHLGDMYMQNVKSMDILGVTFTSSGLYDQHVETRTQKCRNSSFSLSDVGMCYPGLASDTKAYLYKTICQPTLLYGLDYLPVSDGLIRKMDSTQGSIMKRVCGLAKRSHHSRLIRALGIENTTLMLTKITASLYYRIFQVNCPTRDLCIYDLSQYICGGQIVPGTIIDRVIKYGLCPVKCAFEKYMPNSCYEPDGVVDSLRHLLYHDNYIKPWSSEYMLTTLLTKAF
jgi:hypothetical protein